MIADVYRTAMNEHPDVVSAFLSFCLAIVRFYPRVFTVLPHLGVLIQFVIRGLGLQESFSFRINVELLIAMIQQTRMASTSSMIFQQQLQPQLPLIFSSIVLAIAKNPRSHLVSLSELLHVCTMRFNEEIRATFKIMLEQENWPTQQATLESKIAFERAIIK